MHTGYCSNVFLINYEPGEGSNTECLGIYIDKGLRYSDFRNLAGLLFGQGKLNRNCIILKTTI